MTMKYNIQPIQRYLKGISRKLGPFTEDALVSISKSILKGIQINMSGRLIQRRSGDLYNSWGFKITPVGSNRIRAEIASDGTVDYAEIHDSGGQTGRNHRTTIPARYYYSRVPMEKQHTINTIIARNLAKMVR